MRQCLLNFASANHCPWGSLKVQLESHSVHFIGSWCTKTTATSIFFHKWEYLCHNMRFALIMFHVPACGILVWGAFIAPIINYLEIYDQLEVQDSTTFWPFNKFKISKGDPNHLKNLLKKSNLFCSGVWSGNDCVTRLAKSSKYTWMFSPGKCCRALIEFWKALSLWTKMVVYSQQVIRKLWCWKRMWLFCLNYSIFPFFIIPFLQAIYLPFIIWT